MASGEDESTPMDRVSLTEELIEKLKDVKSWDEWPWQWTFDEERMSMAWLWTHCINNSCNIHLHSDDVIMIDEEKDELGCGEINPQAPHNDVEGDFQEVVEI